MNQDLAVEKIEIETATDLEVNGPKWLSRRIDFIPMIDKLSGQQYGAWLKPVVDGFPSGVPLLYSVLPAVTIINDGDVL